jgi:hypothetical protein
MQPMESFTSQNGSGNEWSDRISDAVSMELRGNYLLTTNGIQRRHKRLESRGPYQFFKVVSNSLVEGPEGVIRTLIAKILNACVLPDLAFIYFNHDVPPNRLRRDILPDLFQRKVPIFVSARRRTSSHFILFSDWHYDIGNDSDGWNATYVELSSPTALIPDWKDKEPRLIWRGKPNDGYYDPQTWSERPRGKLVCISLNEPGGLIDAGFVGFYPWFAADIDFFQKLCCADRMSEVEQARYKYQIDLDGTTATFTGLGWKLLSGSLVFKQHSPNIMWFHHLIKPWEHYVPVRQDLSDLQAMLDWARQHDTEAAQIAARGRQFALEYLSPLSIRHYAFLVLLNYANRYFQK